MSATMKFFITLKNVSSVNLLFDTLIAFSSISITQKLQHNGEKTITYQ